MMVHKTQKTSFQPRWWEIPPAIASWLFFRTMKAAIGVLYTRYLDRHRAQGQQWRVLSAENLAKPLSVPVLMTKGPRWNTHAIIGTLGPIAVREQLHLDRPTMAAAAGSWIGCVYRFPDYATVASFDDRSGEEPIALPPGRYTVGLRYYHPRSPITFPPVTIDGGEGVAAVTVPADVNDCYRDLKQRDRWFYRWLHFYIFTLLQWRDRLPAAWVEREYLPVGATDTQFFYGVLYCDQGVTLGIETVLLTQYDFYWTQYNRSSLPLAWQMITAAETAIAPQDQEGFYLIRCRRRSPESPSLQWQENEGFPKEIRLGFTETVK